MTFTSWKINSVILIKLKLITPTNQFYAIDFWNVLATLPCWGLCKQWHYQANMNQQHRILLDRKFVWGIIFLFCTTCFCKYSLAFAMMFCAAPYKYSTCPAFRLTLWLWHHAITQTSSTWNHLWSRRCKMRQPTNLDTLQVSTRTDDVFMSLHAVLRQFRMWPFIDAFRNLNKQNRLCLHHWLVQPVMPTNQSSHSYEY